MVAAVALDLGSIWPLFVVAVGIGLTETLYDTSAQSILPQVVGRDQLSRANGRLAAAELTTNEFLGPPLGGVLVAAGAALAFVTPAALWLIAMGLLLLMPGSFRIERQQPTTMRAEIAEGVRFLWRQPLLRRFAVMTGVFNFASNAAWAVLVLYAVGPTSPMGLTEPAYGLLLTTVAAGSLLGSLAAEPIERRLGRARALGLAFLLAAMLVGAPAVTADPVLVGVAFFLGGIGIVVANVIIVSLRQRITPDRLLGRVNSGYRLVGWGTRPLGAAAGGVLAELIGLPGVFLVMGMLTLSLLIALIGVTDAAIDEAPRPA
jgi:MFS family permease